MLQNEFEQLCKGQEGPCLDFKSEMYTFEDTDPVKKNLKRANFVKDIISMANTIRDTNSYIVLGIKANIDGSKEFVGIQKHIDDAELQDKLTWVDPRPQFTYTPLEYLGKIYGIITIPPYRDAGPFFYSPKDSIGNKLHPHRLYIRRGSKNDEASDEEGKSVYKWFDPKGSVPIAPAFEPFDT